MMRFKLILSVKSDTFGNTLPVSYQYELSSCIRRKITEQEPIYNDWLQKNGFSTDISLKYSLFSISNLYVPKIIVEGDRLQVLAKRVQMWISFLPERNTREFVEHIFINQHILVGDKKSRVELVVEEIIESEPLLCADSIDYLTLSPVVIASPRSNKSVEYLAFDHPAYLDTLLEHLLEKYRFFYGKEFPYESVMELEFLSPPKRKGIFIKRFTPNESKIIGYMYKFRLTVHPILHQLIYNTGLGDKISLGFGAVEIIR